MKTSLLISLVAAMLLSGCTWGKQAPPRVVAAPPVDDANVPRSVIVKGNVKYPVVPWSQNLTVARAIVIADYSGPRDPTSIVIRRQGDRFFVSTQRLMQGIVDPWLAPGDIVELWTAPLVQPTYTYDMFSSFESVHAGLARTDDEQ